MTKLFCSIYKSKKKEGMFLFVRKEKALREVPEALLELFGQEKLFTHMILDEQKKLARVDASKVISEITGKGYYLQMPEEIPEYRKALAKDGLSKSSLI